MVRTGMPATIDLVKDTPERLSEQLVAGDLDIGPISLVELLAHGEQLRVLPDLAVGSDGPVQSCVLVSTRADLGDLDGLRVALGSTSRTTVRLAKLLLEEQHGAKPSYVSMPPDLTAMLLEADAAVLIGDPALRATHTAPGRGLHVFDMGAEWRDWTGLPMVFAVWAARRDWATENPDELRRVHEAFVTSRDVSLKHVAEIAALAARTEDLSAARLEDYFLTLDFSLGDRQIAGLREFARRIGMPVPSGLGEPL